MLLEIVIFFLGLSLLLYCLLAGADFGAGILEAFPSSRKEEERKVSSYAMGPVWEANHVWLIVAVVIMFNAFPAAFSKLSIVFHIPLTLLLIGIVLRGCAFTFRHYDVRDDRTHVLYERAFVAASFIAPFAFGLIGGAAIFGTVPAEAKSFSELFVAPWFTPLSFSTGAFACTLCAFLAAVYLVGETDSPPLKALFIRKAWWATAAAVISGGIVFLFAALAGSPFIGAFFGNPISLTCMASATVLLPALIWALRTSRGLTSRLIVAAQAAAIVLGWFVVQYPVILRQQRGAAIEALTFHNTRAPDATLLWLVCALVFAMLLVLPSLYYLFKVFKFSAPSGSES